MLYQPILTDNASYVARISKISEFFANIHHEIEIIYCRKGYAEIFADEKLYRLNDGDALVIGSMISHRGVKTEPENEGLVVEIGPVFLGERFHDFVSAGITGKMYSLKNNDRICLLLDEMFLQCEEKNRISELLLIGNIYKLCAYILKDFDDGERKEVYLNFNTKSSVEKALELAYHHYSEPVTVDEAAAVCGYGKSNFCKIFKNDMGISFHSFLNSIRVKNAIYLLSEKDKSLDEIAVMVGLSEAKTMCRVFKKITGMTPGEYRKKYYN